MLLGTKEQLLGQDRRIILGIEHLLQNQLGSAIGIGDVEGKILPDRHGFGTAVNRGGGAEHKVLYLIFFHFFIFFKKTLDFFLESDIITMLLTGNNKKQHKTVQCGMV